MKWRKLLGGVAGTAVTIAAGAVNPALGAVVGSALASGAGAKEVGKLHERKGGTPVHKIGAPVAAVTGAGVAAQFVDPQALCDAVQAICASPLFVSGAIGAASIGAHSIWNGLQASGKKRG